MVDSWKFYLYSQNLKKHFHAPKYVCRVINLTVCYVESHFTRKCLSAILHHMITRLLTQLFYRMNVCKSVCVCVCVCVCSQARK